LTPYAAWLENPEEPQHGDNHRYRNDPEDDASAQRKIAHIWSGHVVSVSAIHGNISNSPSHPSRLTDAKINFPAKNVVAVKKLNLRRYSF
jgi:hypothetical protein